MWNTNSKISELQKTLEAINSYSLKQTKETFSYSPDGVTGTRFTLTLEITKNKRTKNPAKYETMVSRY